MSLMKVCLDNLCAKCIVIKLYPFAIIQPRAKIRKAHSLADRWLPTDHAYKECQHAYLASQIGTAFGNVESITETIVSTKAQENMQVHIIAKCF